jgi:hypothetical protein
MAGRSPTHFLFLPCDATRHADVNTTHAYVEIDMAMKQRMLEKAGAPSIEQPLPWQKPDILQWLAALTERSV